MFLQKLTIIFLLFLCVKVTAQHMSVKSFKLIENDTEALLEQKKTPDGEPCVLIKVVTRYKNFQFDFYAAPVCLVENSKKIHEVWVWVRDDARRFEIQHKDLGVYRGRLPERLQPYKVYEMVLTTEKFTTVKQEELDKLKEQKEQLAKENEKLKNNPFSSSSGLPGFVMIKTTSKGAENSSDILIDGYPTEKKTPVSISLVEGAHTVTLKNKWYEDETKTFNIKSGQTKNLNVTFSKPLFGTVLIKSDKTSTVFMDGTNTNTSTPLTKSFLSIGTHTVTLKNKWYEDETRTFNIKGGQAKNLNVTFSKPLFGTLELTTTEGAEIFIDRKKIGTGRMNKSLMAGDYSIALKKEGYFEQRFTQTVIKGKTNRIKKPLEAKKGTLNISSNPSGATIKLNGKSVGSTPFVKTINIGRYDLTIKKRGYVNHKTIVKIKHNKTTAENITLQYGTTFDKTFGGHVQANSIVQTADGGYAVAGSTLSKGAGGYDMWVVKLEANGNKQWDKTFGGNYWDKATSIVQTRDGGYAVAGITSSKGAGRYDMWVVKLDANGNKQWDKTFGGSNDDEATSIIQTADGGYAVAGITLSKGAGARDMWVVKLDANGYKQWDKTFGGSYWDEAKSIVQTSDGGYAVAGITLSKGAGHFDMWVVKLDANGNKQWDKTFGGSYWDKATSIVQTRDGGYAVAGYTYSKGARYYEYDMWVVKLDARGKRKWDKTFGGSDDDYANSIVQTSDGGYAVAGYTESKGAGGYDMWVVKLNARGKRKWNKTFGGSDDDKAYSIVQTSDSGYAVAGYTKSKGAGKKDMWVLKLDKDGNL